MKARRQQQPEVMGKTQAITIDGDVSKEVTYGTEHWNDEIVIALADIENTLKGRTLATEVALCTVRRRAEYRTC